MKKIMFDDHYGLTKAVLEGVKTMTRRVITLPEKWHGIEVYGFSHVKGETALTLLDGDDFIIEDHASNQIGQILPTYKIGEEVAVAQAYRDIKEYNPDSYEDVMLSDGVICGASHPYSNLMSSAGWGNKMFVRPTLMPNRIRIISIKVERLQDISEEECLREGVYHEPIELEDHDGLSYYASGYAFNGSKMCYNSPRDAFAAIIDKISGKGTWEKNPWVFAYSFELIK